ncbi:4084_t:CDS:2 [Funneliformis mosseae]|uniref:4084_t:CDS:1 n=1 Tax=Funneliformis mosseae TaxID=27381 RepID=A0A9N8Z3K7_FUNMO|nr:4084_t:CDS:2 [Funneliformis mosseae]
MLYGDINGLEGEYLRIWLRETLKLSFEHVHKNHMLDASNFFYDYKDIILDGPTGNENIRIKESYYFGGSKRKATKLKIITTEEAVYNIFMSSVKFNKVCIIISHWRYKGIGFYAQLLVESTMIQARKTIKENQK